MNPIHIFFVFAAAFPLALLLNNILEITKLINQLGIFFLCVCVISLIYNKLLKKPNFDSDKILNKAMISFMFITFILLFVKTCIYIYEVGGLKTAKGLFTFLGLIVLIIIGTQILSIHNTFDDLDELYKLAPKNNISSKSNTTKSITTKSITTKSNTTKANNTKINSKSISSKSINSKSISSKANTTKINSKANNLKAISKK